MGMAQAQYPPTWGMRRSRSEPAQAGYGREPADTLEDAAGGAVCLPGGG